MMRHVNREKAIELLDKYAVDWPARESVLAMPVTEFRDSGWYWVIGPSGAVYLESPEGEWITQGKLDAHKARQKGDPNAHESVRGEFDKVDAMMMDMDKPEATDKGREVLGDKPVERDGEGLPPVGAKVDVFDAGYEMAYGEELIGKTVTVRAWVHQEHCNVAVLDHEGALYCFRSEMLRPARSDEEKAVEEAMKDIGAEDGDFASILATVERMVAAGYRKTEGA